MMSYCISSPIVPLTLTEKDGALAAVAFGGTPGGQATPLLQEAARQLEEYFAGRRQNFDLPLAPQGTPFQQKVWAALHRIPYGHTAAYNDIAQTIGSPNACRAVGMANHRNPIPVIIPCHRVIGTGGKLTGYAGGLDKKQLLLELESRYSFGR